MSNTVLKGIAVATAVSIGALTLASPAEAGRRHWRHHGHHGGAAAAAIIGLGLAAALASRPSYGYYYGPPAYAYAPPPPRYYGPTYYSSYAPPPWTPAWYEFCSAKYRSFDPASGTFQPYHGPRQLCR
jgi:hypothetical protein